LSVRRLVCVRRVRSHNSQSANLRLARVEHKNAEIVFDLGVFFVPKNIFSTLISIIY
jgi:hypothetical protein